MNTTDKKSVSDKIKAIPTNVKSSVKDIYGDIERNPYRNIRNVITFIGVFGCVLVIWLALQPKLIFLNTTPTGGDMGAHVWWPAYMRDYLLPAGRIFGWSMDAYAGFPVGQYYFPVPALFVVLFDLIPGIPYNVAFKLVAVLGSVFLPLSVYIFGRSLRAPKPIPMLMAFASTAFLFFTGDPRGNETGTTLAGQTTTTLADYKNAGFNQRIMGGPLVSSMAGEFSFAIALTFGFLFLAAFYIMLRDGKGRTRVAILFTLCVLSHLVVAIFLAFATIALWGCVYISRKGASKTLGYTMLVWIIVNAMLIGSVGKYFFDGKKEATLGLVFLSTLLLIAVIVYIFIKDRQVIKKLGHDSIPLIVGMLLSSVWLVPLLTRFSYTSNMRYEKLKDLASTPVVNELYELYIAPHYFWWPVLVPAVIGIILSVAMARKSIIPLVVTAIAIMFVFANWPEGHAWNLRFLPFWYLMIFFLAAVGYGELFRVPPAIMSFTAYRNKNKKLLVWSQVTRTVICAGLVALFFLLLAGIGSDPVDAAGQPVRDSEGKVIPRRFPDRRGYGDAWAKYNFEGYEGKPAYPEFKATMDAAKKLSPGRAMWEQTGGAYGTTLAMTLLPYYTDHKVSSMEGIYFEAAGNTAYHFLTVAELSKSASNAMRWPQCEKKKDGFTKVDPECFDSYYGTISDFNRGVEHLKMMGVKYYFAHSEEAKKAADSHKDLKLIAKVKDQDKAEPFGWNIYEVKNSSLVTPVVNDPVVITDKQDASDWAQSGNVWLYNWFNNPGDYPLFVANGPDEWKRSTASKALKDKLSKKEQSADSDVKVSDIKLKEDSISFHVNKTGEPVLVKVSYYPTFKAEGAGEVYRASPNFMVVVPTEKDVTISMKRDSWEWLSIVLFISGIVGCVLLYIGERRGHKRITHYWASLSAKVKKKD